MNKYKNKYRTEDNIYCRHCDNTKIYTLFRKDKRYEGGYGVICNSCISIKSGYKERKKEGTIYILESNGIYKIGLTTRNVRERIMDFQTGNPYKLNILNEYKTNNLSDDEYKLHERFNDKHFRGEWFELNIEDLNYIDNYFNLQLSKD